MQENGNKLNTPIEASWKKILPGVLRFLWFNVLWSFTAWLIKNSGLLKLCTEYWGITAPLCPPKKLPKVNCSKLCKAILYKSVFGIKSIKNFFTTFVRKGRRRKNFLWKEVIACFVSIRYKNVFNIKIGLPFRSETKSFHLLFSVVTISNFFFLFQFFPLMYSQSFLITCCVTSRLQYFELFVNKEILLFDCSKLSIILLLHSSTQQSKHPPFHS